MGLITESYETQLENTKQIAINHPLEFFPFYFFEPRRYVKNINTAAQEIAAKHAFYHYYLEPVGQDEHFMFQGKPLTNKLVLNKIVKLSNMEYWKKILQKNHDVIQNYNVEVCSTAEDSKGIFWGYKMYTRYGFRPDDYLELEERKGLLFDKSNRLFKFEGSDKSCDGPQYLPQLADFYAYCMKNKIPIVCHCNAGGSIFNDVYNLERFDWNKKWGNDTGVIEGIDIRYDNDKSVAWLDHHYVAPHNWERVLSKYPDLKISLAHFGGGDKWEPFTANNPLFTGK